MTDEELIARIADRDETALRELYRRYAPYLKALARRMTGDEHDVEPVVQDTFVKVWEAAARFDPGKASCETWLVTMGHRLMVNRLRARRRPPARVTAPEGGLEDTASAPAPERTARGRPPDALATLEPDSRRLLELAFFAGHTHRELAVLTGRPLATITSRIGHALAQFRKALMGRGRGTSGSVPPGDPRDH
jgi:RNA polymerase sigma-70 factor (ECF subfamily)